VHTLALDESPAYHYDDEWQPGSALGAGRLKVH
jgi:hypothetical protein